MVQCGPVEFVGAVGAFRPLEQVPRLAVAQRPRDELTTQHGVRAASHHLDAVRHRRVRLSGHAQCALPVGGRHLDMLPEARPDDALRRHALHVVSAVVDLQDAHHLQVGAQRKRLAGHVDDVAPRGVRAPQVVAHAVHVGLQTTEAAVDDVLEARGDEHVGEAGGDRHERDQRVLRRAGVHVQTVGVLRPVDGAQEQLQLQHGPLGVGHTDGRAGGRMTGGRTDARMYAHIRTHGRTHGHTHALRDARARRRTHGNTHTLTHAHI